MKIIIIRFGVLFVICLIIALWICRYADDKLNCNNKKTP